MSTVWKDEEIILLEGLRPVCTSREICSVFAKLGFDRTPEGVSKKSRQLGIAFRDLGAPAFVGLSPTEQAAIEAVLAERGACLALLAPPPLITSSEKGRATTIQREATKELFEALQEIRAATPRIVSLSNKTTTAGKLSLVLLLSDQHVGKKVVDENNQVLYNMATALSRIEMTPDLLLQQAPVEAKEANEVVVVLAGDLVDGEDVYPSQSITVEQHVAGQVIAVSRSLWCMLQKLRSIFPLVRVVTARGNHGRAGLSTEANWDNMVFQHLELLADLQADPNLTIRNRYAEFNNFEVRGWRGHVRHKAPAQADTPGSIARFAGWHNIHNYDFLCYGHYHHWGIFTYNGKPIIRNGSLSGGDDYAESFGCYDNPTQLVFGVTTEKLCSFITPIAF